MADRVTISLTRRQRDLVVMAARIGLQQHPELFHPMQREATEKALDQMVRGTLRPIDDAAG